MFWLLNLVGTITVLVLLLYITTYIIFGSEKTKMLTDYIWNKLFKLIK